MRSTSISRGTYFVCNPNGRSVQNGFENFEAQVHARLPDSLFWLKKGIVHSNSFVLKTHYYYDILAAFGAGAF